MSHKKSGTYWATLITAFLKTVSKVEELDCVDSAVLVDVSKIITLTQEFRRHYDSVYRADYGPALKNWKRDLSKLFTSLFVDVINSGRIVGFFDVGRYVCEEVLCPGSWTEDHELLNDCMTHFFIENNLMNHFPLEDIFLAQRKFQTTGFTFLLHALAKVLPRIYSGNVIYV
ncbi:bcl-2-like protein [Murine herpesvirus strain 4556]|uniref:Apoptosis regulator Bcl-2 homolog n=5 Tax=Orthoherpesviridae TaxID=3044472 RepID=ARBH_MHV68|nr:bcl-2 homolog (gene 16?) [Murid gammaherpesvirus 4]P89884.1 RecName: Full=Apoptosis regulator Bcl-2 homolog; Short=vBcl-2; AltName: Full=Protein M11 [Murid gammaherpesvirus 4]ACB05761.1 M11 protein [Murine herpesvirus 72]QJQ80262.1 bcl-2-like protein [Murine herpesvirus]UNZ86703.1 bcl-2-like protein [Murine herpesvirus strain 72]UNZ86780.1 bcl-2-like protein [Murine herpesvirus strain 4556]AAB50016.1 v-bcl-2 [Murid gammaherpesvirus 4]